VRRDPDAITRQAALLAGIVSLIVAVVVVDRLAGTAGIVYLLMVFVVGLAMVGLLTMLLVPRRRR
jgi:hypothetical protein